MVAIALRLSYTTLMRSLSSYLRSSLGAILASLLCIGAVGLLQLPELNALKNKSQIPTKDELQQQVNREALRLKVLKQTPSFGFDNLFADWVYLNFLQYFGDDDARNVTGYALSPNYFDIIIDRDPRFLGVYIGLSTSVSLYAAQPEKSVALMNQGLKSLSPQSPPKSYYVWRQKGIDELLFLGDKQAAQNSFEKAAEWASSYSDEESQSVAALSRKTAQFLQRNPNSKLAQIEAWTMILQSVPDDRTRKIAVRRIRALGGDVTVTPQGQLQVKSPAKD